MQLISEVAVDKHFVLQQLKSHHRLLENQHKPRRTSLNSTSLV